jgi:hypothetical protein
MDFFDWLVVNTDDLLANDIPDDITVVFPENKPPTPEEQKYIVENQNETDEVPQQSNLLSDRNSRARNMQQSEQFRENSPQNQGNTDNPGLSNPFLQQRQRQTYNKPFTSDALTGKQTDPNDEILRRNPREKEQEESEPSQTASQGFNEMYNQEKFSVKEVGPISLSTYAWEFTPYIRKFKEKLQRIWTAPPAYHMGLIHGETSILFEISKQGTLVKMRLIDHKGHESLQASSMNAIKSMFPFLELPKDFPEETLIIRITLEYPDISKFINQRR